MLDPNLDRCLFLLDQIVCNAAITFMSLATAISQYIDTNLKTVSTNQYRTWDIFINLTLAANNVKEIGIPHLYDINMLYSYANISKWYLRISI